MGPAARHVDLLLDEPRAMQRGDDGWFSAEIKGARAGARYKFRIDDEIDIPDPACDFQPEDVNGPSELIDHGRYQWEATDWRGRPWHDTVLLESQVGAFTPQGTCLAMIDKLDHLAATGIKPARRRRGPAARQISRTVERRLSPRLAFAADRRIAGLLRRLPALTAGGFGARFRLALSIRAKFPHSGATSPAAISRRRPLSISCKTTIRSATVRSATDSKLMRVRWGSKLRSRSPCSLGRRSERSSSGVVDVLAS